MRFLLIDFQDSFTFNIVSELLYLGIKVDVISYQKKTKIAGLINQYDGLILGPGPGHPSFYRSYTKDYIGAFIKPILGICLGHQILLDHFGCEVTRSSNILHGQSEKIVNNGFFSSANLNELTVQRYNSLAVMESELVKLDSKITDYHYLSNANGELMAFRCARFMSYQFHPESVGTFCRSELFESYLNSFYNR